MGIDIKRRIAEAVAEVLDNSSIVQDAVEEAIEEWIDDNIEQVVKETIS